MIIGVGLLGGSIGMALRNRKLAKQVVGVGRPGKLPLRAVELGAIDHAESEVKLAAQGADLVICCTPVQQIAELVMQCVPSVAPNALITDVGSTKLTIVKQIDAMAAGQGISNVPFIGSHPLAGGTDSGVDHAREDLLVDSLVVVTPHKVTAQMIKAPMIKAQSTEHLSEKACALWQSLGAQTMVMSAAEHDDALAQTSHLPHIVAAALAAATPRDLLPLTATGWQSTTRVAKGNAKLWRQILEENRLPALQALKNFAKVLERWQQALEQADGVALEQLLEDGKATRDALGS